MLRAFADKQCSIAVFLPYSVFANDAISDASILTDPSVKVSHNNELVLCRCAQQKFVLVLIESLLDLLLVGHSRCIHAHY